MALKRTRVLDARKKPSQSRSLETVGVILTAAAHILERSGLEAFSTNAVAEKAGVSIGSLYQYFPNKESLLLALNERFEDEMVAKMFATLSPDLSLTEGLHHLIKTMLDAHSQTVRLNRILEEQEAQLQPVEEKYSEDATALKPLADFLKDHSREVGVTNFSQSASDVLTIARSLTESAFFTPVDDSYDLSEKILNSVLGYLKAGR